MVLNPVLSHLYLEYAIFDMTHHTQSTLHRNANILVPLEIQSPHISQEKLPSLLAMLSKMLLVDITVDFSELPSHSYDIRSFSAKVAGRLQGLRFFQKRARHFKVGLALDLHIYQQNIKLCSEDWMFNGKIKEVFCVFDWKHLRTDFFHVILKER